MTALRTALFERKEDFLVHLTLAQALDRRLFESGSVPIGETSLTVRHLLTIKSGLIVHLYNIVEAVMTRTIEEVGAAVRSTPPSEWSSDTLKEWLRLYASTGIDGNEETRLDVVHKAALKLLTIEPIQDLKFKKPSGTWSDKVIFTFSKRLKVNFRLTPEIARKIKPSEKYGDQTPLEFLADRRNAIAHGRRSFESGAVDLTLLDIQDLASVTLEYMEFAVDAFQNFVNDRQFVATAI
ncbi:MAE_28990/MAE_18760 family HEPN-like nuclease [Pseudomonas chengduensis]|uniref:MAE_28990/MAE_18760 family HEPN-like nuclease n=1 Tax=Pseudomonas sediminis TaxID=1691904 RepID=UPI00244888B2|nr:MULTISPECIES: MAE_28990/MAE_18760 family HEPN-like nuclease [Pseudomonas]MDG9757854.1 MAE_28990/MAE_18760 family HEPN-like nuclease [Pseudomonas sediminis]MDH0622940.1 MAE_28990/MAE_18760 family HEPN-like nuclease [Pseudomonas chengduensis]MDH1664565.1 MAE_28990/MAE_18760 family HEPN-like nuclease [Pseudomonas chengduensis]